jgi:hypothetical protein
MEVDAVGAHFAQQVDQFGGCSGRAHRTSEWVATGVANGPQAESEFVLGFGRIVRHLNSFLKIIKLNVDRN